MQKHGHNTGVKTGFWLILKLILWINSNWRFSRGQLLWQEMEVEVALSVCTSSTRRKRGFNVVSFQCYILKNRNIYAYGCLLTGSLFSIALYRRNNAHVAIKRLQHSTEEEAEDVKCAQLAEHYRAIYFLSLLKHDIVSSLELNADQIPFHNFVELILHYL